MKVVICPDRETMGAQAARGGADRIRHAIKERGTATIVVATGASQFTMLDQLVREPDVDWRQVSAFHLDEYLGMPMSHPASFRRYLKERFVDHVPLRKFHFIDGEAVPAAAECARLGQLIGDCRIDVAFIGIGENGHLAFNDPPADFVTEQPYLLVELDEACRRQQLGEGWFPTLDDVPRQAISMSVRQILRAQGIVCTVPDARKADAVVAAVEGPITPQVPASILQEHHDATIYLDPPAASRLKQSMS
jgi:glucosamine-6-phosphate deaminase